MKKLLTVLFAIYTQILISVEPIYISLGSNCTPAYRFKELHVRTVSYPFDWLTSPYESIYRALEDDLQGIFTELSLFFNKTAVVDRYGFVFAYNWTYEGLPYNKALDEIDWESQVPALREKYIRRAKRFVEACTSGRKVVFVRYEDIDPERAIQLRDLIKYKYPNLQFTLIVVSPSEEFRNPWGLENIKNFCIPATNVEIWKEIFKEESLECNAGTR